MAAANPVIPDQNTEKPQRVEAHEKKDVTKLKGSLSEVGRVDR